MKILSFPVEIVRILYSHPLVQRMTAYQFGAYSLLVLSYWTTGVPLPTSDNKLALLTRSNLNAWKQSKDLINLALSDTMPEIEELYVKRMGKYNNNLEKIKKVNLNNLGRFANNKRNKKVYLSEKESYVGIVAPHKAIRYKGDGKTDMTLRGVAERNNSSSNRTGGLLGDTRKESILIENPSNSAGNAPGSLPDSKPE